MSWKNGTGCFTGDTLVAVADGRKAVPLAELAQSDEAFPCYAYGGEHVSCVPLATAHKTREQAHPLMRLYLSNGKHVVCTLDHEFLTAEQGYVEAAKLRTGTQLMGRLGADPIFVQAVAPHGRFEDVFCLAVPTCHNLLLAAGVYVHDGGMVPAQSNAGATLAGVHDEQ